MKIGVEDYIQIIIAGISFLAIIVSIIAIIISVKQNKNDKVYQKKSKYFDEIFMEYLITKIPRAKEYIRFDNNKLSDEERFIEELTSMLHKSMYYKISEYEFYKGLSNRVDYIEQYISDSKNKDIVQEDQGHFWVDFNSLLEDLYRYIDEFILSRK